MGVEQWLAQNGLQVSSDGDEVLVEDLRTIRGGMSLMYGLHGHQRDRSGLGQETVDSAAASCKVENS